MRKKARPSDGKLPLLVPGCDELIYAWYKQAESQDYLSKWAP